MKKIMVFISLLSFIFGIMIICTADSGIVGNFVSANLAGGLISIFSGVCIAISVYFYYKNSK